MEQENNPSQVNPQDKPKPRRGNPNFVRGKKNTYYDKPKENMAEDTATEKTTTTSESNSTSEVKKEIPKDIFSDVIPEAEILPLDGEVKQQAHGVLQDTAQTSDKKPGTETSGGDNKPPTSDNTAATSDSSAKPPDSTMTATNQAKTPEEIKTGAEQAAMLAIHGYERLHDIIRYFAKKDQKVLTAEHEDGKINLNRKLPLGKNGSEITLNNFISLYNEGIDENIIVSEKFKENVTPPLVRIAIKRGWYVGDELTVCLLVAEDLGVKISVLTALLKSANMLLELSRNEMKKKNSQKHEDVKKEESQAEIPNSNEQATWRESTETTETPPH